MDVPNERSSHVEVTPRGGGIAVVAALGAGLLVGRDGGWDVAIVFLGALILGAVGLTDDFRGLSAKVRLGILLLVGALAGLLLDSPLPLVLAVPAMAVWVAAYVNAFNFMDGINGISGLTGLVSGVAYSLMGLEFDSDSAVVIGAALAGASLCVPALQRPERQGVPRRRGVVLPGVRHRCSWLDRLVSGRTPRAWPSPTAVYLADTGRRSYVDTAGALRSPRPTVSMCISSWPP